MNKHRTRFVRLTVMMSSVMLLPGLTCVSRVTQTVGDGITAVGATGILGGISQTANAIGTGLAFLGDIVGLIAR